LFLFSRFASTEISAQIYVKVEKWSSKLCPQIAPKILAFINSLRLLSDLFNANQIPEILFDGYMGHRIVKSVMEPLKYLDELDRIALKNWHNSLYLYNSELGDNSFKFDGALSEAVDELCVTLKDLPRYRIARILLKGVKSSFNLKYLHKKLERTKLRLNHHLTEVYLDQKITYQNHMTIQLGNLLFNHGVYFAFAICGKTRLLQDLLRFMERYSFKFLDARNNGREEKKVIAFLKSLRYLSSMKEEEIDKIGPILFQASLGKKITPRMIFTVISLSKRERFLLKKWQYKFLGFNNEICTSSLVPNIVKNSLEEMQFCKEEFILAKLLLKSLYRNYSSCELSIMLDYQISLHDLRVKGRYLQENLESKRTFEQVLKEEGVYVLFINREIIEYSDLLDPLILLIKYLAKCKYGKRIAARTLKFIISLSNLYYLLNRADVSTLASLFLDAYVIQRAPKINDKRISVLLDLSEEDRGNLKDFFARINPNFNIHLLLSPDREMVIKALREL
jgi:hypothetical protein